MRFKDLKAVKKRILQPESTYTHTHTKFNTVSLRFDYFLLFLPLGGVRQMRNRQWLRVTCDHLKFAIPPTYSKGDNVHITLNFDYEATGGVLGLPVVRADLELVGLEFLELKKKRGKKPYVPIIMKNHKSKLWPFCVYVCVLVF